MLGRSPPENTGTSFGSKCWHRVREVQEASRALRHPTARGFAVIIKGFLKPIKLTAPHTSHAISAEWGEQAQQNQSQMMGQLPPLPEQ